MNKLFLIFIFCAFYSKATIFPTTQGSVSLGFGTISSLKSDPFAAYNHQGSLAFAKQNSLSLGFQSQYFVEGLNHACLAGNYRINKTQTLGLGYSFFGNQYYNEGLLKVSFAKKFTSHFGGGISLDYLRMQLPKESYPVKHLLTFEAGIFTSFNSDFDLALQIINPTRVILSKYKDERLPFITNTALFYNPSSKLTLAAEWCQIMNGHGNLKVGINYEVSKNLRIMAGAYNKPVNPGFGISYTAKNISIHLAFALHPYLNATSAAGLTYSPINANQKKL